LKIVNLLKLADTVEDKDLLIAMSLPRLRLHMDEGLTIFQELMKGHGDRVIVLEQMLPSMANPFACRAIVANVLRGRETDKVQCGSDIATIKYYSSTDSIDGESTATSASQAGTSIRSFDGAQCGPL